MLYLLLLLLIVSLRIAFTLSDKNILSAWVIGHCMYIVSTLVLIFNYDEIRNDLDINTIFIILSTLFFIGLGELYVRYSFFKTKKHYYPDSTEKVPILISNRLYIFSIVVIILGSFYEYYKFNIISSSLGGTDFVSKYVLMRLYKVDTQNGIEKDVAVVPFATPMVYYVAYFVKFSVYFYIYLFLYNSIFKIKNLKRSNYWNLIPIITYLPICFFTTTRSVFIELLGAVGIMAFIMIKQQTKSWNKNLSNKYIIKKGCFIIAFFIVVFSFVGQFKEQDVSENFGEVITSYAGASILGLDEYISGRVEKESDYYGQVTFSNVFVILNKFGFKFEPPKYHQEEYVWGKHGEVSNLFSSPYYFLIDLPLVIVFVFYFLMGMVYALLMDSIKYGKFKISDFEGYTLTVIIYHSIIMIAISDVFHDLLGSTLLYSIIAIYVVKRIYIRRNLPTAVKTIR